MLQYFCKIFGVSSRIQSHKFLLKYLLPLLKYGTLLRTVFSMVHPVRIVQVKLSLFTWLLLPICVTENHWVLLAAHVPSLTVSIVDSLSFRSSRKYVDKWRLANNAVYNSVTLLIVAIFWTTHLICVLTVFQVYARNDSKVALLCPSYTKL